MASTPNLYDAVSQEDFRFIAGILLRESGVVLESDKDYLIEARLEPLAKREGLKSFAELVALLRKHPHRPLIKKMVSALTTHTTSFYRDLHPFEALRDAILPELIQSRSSTGALNIWSAACSTGQEPYSIACTISEHFPELKSWTNYFLATDISIEALDQARRGSYRLSEINRGMPAKQLLKYFTQTAGEWIVQEEIRRSIDFREMNLAGEWPPIPQMDVIFMRNVLIYFGVTTKKKILQQALRVLKPNGYLILGAPETTLGLEDRFEPVTVGKTMVFRKTVSA